jgi:hypothetical protein
MSQVIRKLTLWDLSTLSFCFETQVEADLWINDFFGYGTMPVGGWSSTSALLAALPVSATGAVTAYDYRRSLLTLEARESFRTFNRYQPGFTFLKLSPYWIKDESRYHPSVVPAVTPTDVAGAPEFQTQIGDELGYRSFTVDLLDEETFGFSTVDFSGFGMFVFGTRHVVTYTPDVGPNVSGVFFAVTSLYFPSLDIWFGVSR